MGICIPTNRYPLSEEQRYYLGMSAVEIYLKTKTNRDVFLKNSDGNSLEGRITTKGEMGILGSLSGITFSAEISSSFGKGNVSFLVSEQTKKGYEAQIQNPIGEA